jgi:hypothetical protein
MYRPPVIAFDYETALTNGVPSVEYYRGDFALYLVPLLGVGRRAKSKRHTELARLPLGRSYFGVKVSQWWRTIYILRLA